MRSLVILFFLIYSSTFCQDQKAQEIIEKYKETVGKERWTKTIIYKSMKVANTEAIDGAVFFNGSLGNVHKIAGKDSSISFYKKKSRLEKISWVIKIKNKDTLSSNLYANSGGVQFLLPDACIANDTTTWHYKGEYIKENQKVYIVTTNIDNFVLSLFFSKEDYLLVGYFFETSKKTSSAIITKKFKSNKTILNHSVSGMYSDYRKVGNLLFPFKVVQTVGSDDKPHTTIFKDIQISDDPLEDVFYIPQHLIDTLKSQD